MRKSVLKGGEGSSVREAIVAHVAHSQQHSSAQHSTAEQDPSQHSCLGNPANGIQSRLWRVPAECWWGSGYVQARWGRGRCRRWCNNLWRNLWRSLWCTYAWRNVLRIMVHVSH